MVVAEEDLERKIEHGHGSGLLPLLCLALNLLLVIPTRYKQKNVQKHSASEACSKALRVSPHVKHKEVVGCPASRSKKGPQSWPAAVRHWANQTLIYRPAFRNRCSLPRGNAQSPWTTMTTPADSLQKPASSPRFSCCVSLLPHVPGSPFLQQLSLPVDVEIRRKHRSVGGIQSLSPRCLAAVRKLFLFSAPLTNCLSITTFITTFTSVVST